MRFLFVDKIHDMKETTITGEKFFPADDPMQYAAPNGTKQIAPGVISEAIGQLVSWLCIKQNDFTGRPVFLFADKIEVHELVRPDSLVKLSGQIDSMDKDTFVFSGSATVNGTLVHSISKCSGYFMPLADLEDPEVSRERFSDMVGEGLVLQDDGQTYDFDSLVDEIVEIKPGESITTRKQMKLDEPFYKDHFPRFPVTPIVMINEMIRAATLRLLEAEGKDSGFLLPGIVSGVKIKSFVKPGEACDVQVKILSKDDGLIQCMAEISKEGKKILRGKYSYRILK